MNDSRDDFGHVVEGGTEKALDLSALRLRDNFT